MKILVLDTLIKQTGSESIISNGNYVPSKSKIHPDTIDRIYQEYRNLAELEKQGENSINNYLNNQNGKKMKGAENIFKYKLNAGDRILYTYGKNLPYVKQEDADSIVLLGYSNHDAQGLLARNKNFKLRQNYKKVSDIVAILDELNIQNISEAGIDIEDINTIAQLLLDPKSYENHIKYVVSDEDWKTKKIEELNVDLTTEQDDCINEYIKSPQPTLILGGGGCGKTLIAIHILNKLNHSNLPNNAYFTQSQELRRKVKEQYENIVSDNDETNANVLDINDFCLGQLNLSRKNLVKIEDFYKFINANDKIKQKLSESNISFQDVWAEIRGTIKGSMQSKITNDIPWQRTTYANQENFGNIKNLSKYIERQNNKQEFVLRYSVDETIDKSENDTSLEKKDKEVLHKIIEYFQKFNPKVRELLENTYLNLSEEETTLEKTNRCIVLEIYKEYKNYCIVHNLYDENDLVCKMFEVFGEDNLPKFDNVIIDEVQDYTELQIFLICKMCGNKNGIIFAGDSHQMINPTMFSIKRLKELFFDNKSKQLSLRIKFLSKNFRCKQEVINVANNLSDVRREVIGKKETEEEQYEYSIREGENPLRLNYSKKNLQNMLSKIMQYPSTVVLVANESAKEYLIELYGKEKYKEERISKIFTVAEIKGMEYQYVVCFNLINTYKDIWERLMQRIIGRKTSKYRYYFNLIYVAITRSQNYLCFLDENCNNELENRLKLNKIDTFDENDLYISRLTASIDAWLQDAKNYEKQRKYQEALQIYEDKIPDDEDSINRCLAHINENDKEYKAAIQYYMLVKDVEAIGYLKDEIKEENKDLYRLCNSIVDPQSISFENGYNQKEILNLIRKYFKNKQEANKIKLFVIEEFNKYLESTF